MFFFSPFTFSFVKFKPPVTPQSKPKAEAGVAHAIESKRASVIMIFFIVF